MSVKFVSGHKPSSITLKSEEIKTLIALLEPSAESSTEAADLYSKLWASYEASLENRYVLFVNVYEIHKAYGGPEEGGWYYTVYDCIEHSACDSVAMAINRTLTYMYDYFDSEATQEIGLSDRDDPYARDPFGLTPNDFSVVYQDWEKSSEYEDERQLNYYATDYVGTGLMIAIEHAPALVATRRRPYFE